MKLPIFFLVVVGAISCLSGCTTVIRPAPTSHTTTTTEQTTTSRVPGYGGDVQTVRTY